MKIAHGHHLHPDATFSLNFNFDHFPVSAHAINTYIAGGRSESTSRGGKKSTSDGGELHGVGVFDCSDRVSIGVTDKRSRKPLVQLIHDWSINVVTTNRKKPGNRSHCASL